jgi:hypothetical protein
MVVSREIMLVSPFFSIFKNKLTIELRTQKVREFLKLAVYIYVSLEYCVLSKTVFYIETSCKPFAEKKYKLTSKLQVFTGEFVRNRSQLVKIY